MTATSLAELWREKTARGKIPFSCHFDLTYRCNLHCVHCYVVKQDAPELSTSEVKAILDQLATAGTLYLALSGGEILLREDFFDIANYARSLHFALRLLTNATLIDESVADRIADLSPEQVSISIYSIHPEIHDGITAVPGSLEKSLRAIRILIARGVRVKIGTALMSQNLDGYREVYELAQSLGASFHADPWVTPRNDGDPYPLRFRISQDDMSRVLADPIFQATRDEGSPPHSSHLDGITCGASHNHCYISPYGDVYPCVQFPLCCGNLRQESFASIWHHSPQILEVRAVSISELVLCGQCDLRRYCYRCPGLAYLEEGDPRLPSEIACQEAVITRQILERRADDGTENRGEN